MKVFLIIVLMLTAQESILISEELQVEDFLFGYAVLHSEDLPSDLSSYTIIVISTPSRLFEENEIEALKTFVKSGGGLMLLAEDNNKDGTTLVMNQIAQEFSITFNLDRIYDENHFEYPSWVTITTFPDHPVFQGVTSIVYTTGCSLEAEGILIKASSRAYAEKYDGLTTYKKGSFPGCMAFLEYGKGRVFACGDKELFDNYITFKDNIIFSMNLFDWLSGHPERISERLSYKSEALKIISEAETYVQAAVENGLKEVFPDSIEKSETLIAEAKTLHTSYRYYESLQKAREAKEIIREGEENAQSMVDTKRKETEACLSKIEKSAREYLPSQFEAALYYVEESEQEKTYLQKIEKLESALTLCNEIQVQLQGAADKEIRVAEENLQAYRGLFGRTAHRNAEIYLENARESYEKGEFSDAIEFAEKSQEYSAVAVKEEKKDYILGAGVVLTLVLVIYILVRR